MKRDDMLYYVRHFPKHLSDHYRLECPSEIFDSIAGWIIAGVRQGLGKGYPSDVLNQTKFLAEPPYLFSTITRCFANVLTCNFRPLTMKLLTSLVSLFILVNPNK